MAAEERDDDAAPQEESAAGAGEGLEPEASDTAAPETADAEQLLLGEDRQEATETEHIRLKALLEAVVYITDEPLTHKQIAEALDEPVERIRPILAELIADYSDPAHGLVIREIAEGYMMGTKVEHHEVLRSFVKNLTPLLKLSMAALETLAVVAYKQPITAPEILEIRGVQGAGVLKTLLDRRLITTAGRKQVIGRPILYKTTKEFLVQFGLKSLSELPTLKEFEELARSALTDSELEDAPSPAAEIGEEIPGGAAEAEPDQNVSGQQEEASGSGEPATGEPAAGEPAAPEESAAPEEPKE